jgi:hypothetical protein
MGWVVSVTPLLHFTTAKGPAVPIVQAAGRASELVGTQGLERLEGKAFASARNRNPGRPACSQTLN